MTLPIRVLFLHGSAGSPKDRTAMYLARHFNCHTPEMPTSDYKGSVDVAKIALLGHRPDVLVGESFGAAIAHDLVCQGLWRGPTVLLCPAVHRVWRKQNFQGDIVWPHNVPLTVVHGTRDEIVPRDDTEALIRSANNPSQNTLVLVDDDHNMGKVVSDEDNGVQLKDIIYGRVRQ